MAQIDVFASLAFVADRNHYVKPKINEKGVIDIKDGRHPVVEKMMPDNTFIANNKNIKLLTFFILPLFY